MNKSEARLSMYRPLTEEQIEQSSKIREACDVFRGVVSQVVPPSQRLSLALEYLEQVAMMANNVILFPDDPHS